jgi:hypothetical protein
LPRSRFGDPGGDSRVFETWAVRLVGANGWSGGVACAVLTPATVHQSC